MPRSTVRRGKLAAEVVTNGLITSRAKGVVASARLLDIRKPSPTRKIKPEKWEETAWFWYDRVEAYHYAVQWIANMVSKATLWVAENGKKTTNQDALDAMESFFGGSDNHSEFLRQMTIHMTVAGEGYVVGQEVDGEDEWQVAAAVVVKQGPDGYKIDGEEVDDGLTFLMRIWRPHPVKRKLSDSPSRPLLPVLSQLDELTAYTSAQLDSGISGNGIILLPLETEFPTPVNTGEGDESEQSQQAGLMGFLEELAENMAASKSTRGDARSRVPMGLQVEGEYLDKVQHLTFWSPLDEHTSEREAAALRRLALGLDMPAEQLTGTGEVNHWGAWSIDDAAIKTHAEPLLDIIRAAVTTKYLRTVLEAGGMSKEDALTFTVEADTAEMRLRPDRSKEAFEAYDRGEIGGAALRREVGFDETDAMEEGEKRTWLLTKLAQGSPSPELVAAAIKELGIDLTVEEPTGGGDEARDDRPLPRSLAEHPTRGIPDTQDDARAASLLATAEAAVFRCLERAGNKMRTVKPTLVGLPTDVSAMDLYQYAAISKEQLDFVMGDAWTQLSRFSLDDGVRAALETHLDNYVRMLITSRKPYDRELLKTYLNLVGRVE